MTEQKTAEKETAAAESTAEQTATSASAEVKATKKGSAGRVDMEARQAVALTEGLGGVLGVKAGMTHIYDNDQMIPVTVLDLRPCVITQLKTKDKDGYTAVQVGFMEKKPNKVNKAEAGHAKAAQANGFHHYQEFRLPADAKVEGLEVGQRLTPEFVEAGQLVDVTAVSKGKGFQGTMKRYNYSGGPKSHGASLVHRAAGSIGQNSDPSKVIKGKKMAGHMGHQKVTTQNLRVVKVDADAQTLLIRGSVPGPKSGIVTIRRAVKPAQKAAAGK